MESEGGNDVRLYIDRDEVSELWRFAESVKIVSADSRQPLIEHFRLLQRLSVKAGDETCHLSLRPLAVGTNDFVVETLSDAVDVQEAMKRIARAYNLVHGGHYNRVESRRGRLVYVIDDRDFPYAFATDSVAAYATLEGVLIFLHAMVSLAAGRDLSPMLRTVRTRRPRRTAPDGLLSFWTTTVRTGSDAYALEYDLETGQVPVSLTHRSGRAVDVYAAVEAMILAREKAGGPTDFRQRVSDAIASGVDDQAEAARRLGVSVATLRRRLADSGTRFRDLRARGLNERAKQMLDRHRHPQDVAETLGFSDSRSFARAFKAWNGVTPSNWTPSVSENVLTE
jgi:AraC-like DNA-binding protein